MAFFPKDDFAKRRGVAMKIMEPKVERGAHRDERVFACAKEFEDNGTFVLNRVMDASPPPLTKVKTFDNDANAPRAKVGNGNILSPAFRENERPAPRLHEPFDDQTLKRLHPAHAEKQRNYEQQVYEHSSHGLMDGFSQQPRQRLHKAYIPAKNCGTTEINGFKGLGQASPDVPQGLRKVMPTEYDPLRMGKFPYASPDRPRGLRTLCAPAHETVQEHFHYTDGVKLEDVMKRENRHPRIHTFETTDYGTANAIDGFNGLGQRDLPPMKTGKKSLHHHLTHMDMATREDYDDRKSSNYQDRYQNYSNMAPPNGGYYHPNMHHTGVISPLKTASMPGGNGPATPLRSLPPGRAHTSML